MRSASSLIVLALFALLVGCAQNAVFELHIRLPSVAESPTGARFARIRTGSERLAFDQTWLTSATPPIELLPDAPQTVLVSIVGTGAQLTQGLRIKVELYASEDGDAIEERRYEFEHPFYQGHYTCYERDENDFADPTLDERDPGGMLRDVLPVVDVDRCDIVGCVSSNTLDTMQCDGSGVHNCERPGAAATASACDEILGRDRNVGM